MITVLFVLLLIIFLSLLMGYLSDDPMIALFTFMVGMLVSAFSIPISSFFIKDIEEKQDSKNFDIIIKDNYCVLYSDKDETSTTFKDIETYKLINSGNYNIIMLKNISMYGWEIDHRYKIIDKK